MQFINKVLWALLLLKLNCILQDHNTVSAVSLRKNNTINSTNSTATNLCSNTTCLNDGICVFIANVTVCACVEGFIGERCEIDYFAELAATELSSEDSTEATTLPETPCSGVVCPGGEECYVFESKAFCPFEPIISIINKTNQESPSTLECESNPCMNNHPCMRINEKEMCFCTNGYEPPLCMSTQQTQELEEQKKKEEEQKLLEQLKQQQKQQQKESTKPPSSSLKPGSKPKAGECNPNPCLNDQTCLEINDEPFCFCTIHYKPPLCS